MKNTVRRWPFTPPSVVNCSKPMENLMFTLAVLAYGLYMFFRVRKELHIFQQNSYRNERYQRWWKKNFNTRFFTTPALAMFGLVPIIFQYDDIGWSLWIFFFLIGSYNLFKVKEKKALVFTQRAMRIFGVTMAIILGLFILTFYLKEVGFQLILLVIIAYLTPIWMMLANILLKPVESGINRWYINDARRILKNSSNLKIIGITGSFGKTSTKHFLEKILSQKYNVVITPGSYNTLMGVVITVRNFLKPIHDVFIVEMGAKQEGDIKEICDLVEPQMGIITAVAEQHLETFGSIDNVQKTKFELAESLPTNGIAILNADYDTITSYQHKNIVQKIYYGLDSPKAKLIAHDVRYTSKGMQFDVYQGGKKILELETKLMGNHNISNILASCAVALEWEVPLEDIRYGVKKIAPVKHRLEVKRQKNGITIIDDAFNSNPAGSKMALEVLHKIEGKKKIIITPGMIELGDKEYDYNKAFGEHISEVCDYVILVGNKQTKPIQDGLKAKNYDKNKLFVASDLRVAQSRLKQIIEVGDVVLYENDLPDTY